MQNFDILVVGELNVDLILNKIQTFPKLGTEILAKEMTLTLGSSSGIFACNASALGARVAFLGKIGNDYFGSLIEDSLRSKNVNTDHIIRSSDYVTGATIALSFDENRAMITHPGAMEYLSRENISCEILRTAKHLHVSSIFLQPLLKKDLCEVFKMAKDLGLTTSLDTQWDPLEQWDINLPKLLPLVDVFIPNQDEILALTKQKNVFAAIDAIKKFSNIIVVKMGNKGSVAHFQDQLFEVPSYLNSAVVDTIGAGDSFDAGFVSRFVKGRNLESCLKFANLAGAINTTAAGGTTAFSSYEKIKETALRRFNVNILDVEN